MESLLNFFCNPIIFFKELKQKNEQKNINELAQKIANLLMLLCFKVNENFKIKSYFHLTMFVLPDGHKFYAIFPEISHVSDENIETARKEIIKPAISKNTDKKCIVCASQLLLKNKKYYCVIIFKYNHSFYGSKKYDMSSQLGYGNDGTIANYYIFKLLLEYNGTKNIQFYPDYKNLIQFECDNELLQLVAKYFKINFDEAIDEYDKYETFLLSQTNENINAMKNELEKIKLELTDFNRLNKKSSEHLERIRELNNLIEKKPNPPCFDKIQLDIIAHNYNVFLNAINCDQINSINPINQICSMENNNQNL